LLPADPGASANGDDRYPVKLSSAGDGADGAEIVTTPAIADLDGDGADEVIAASNEVIPGDPQLPTSPFDILGQILASGTGSNPVYAIHGDGTEVSGWPVMVGVAAGDLLPLVLPGHDAAVLDEDGDGNDEVSVSAATGFTGKLVNGDGSDVSSYTNAAANSPDQGPVINLADYPSIGDLSGQDPPNPLVLKGGLTVNGAANLLAVNQNLPFSHVEQAWDPSNGNPVAGYPLATDDFQLVSQASIARVAGSGEERQVLVGTGLYNLHAYGPNGTEAPDGPGGPEDDWPKFTGGWQQATPAIGDADGDGDLDVATLTREGWSFLWSTGVDACDDSNEEWWTFHHDERSSANYGTDGRPPGSPEDLTASRDPGDDSVTFEWTAPGDDWLCGTADQFRVIVASSEIDEPSDGTTAVTEPAADGSGATVERSLDAATVGDATHAAILYRDEAGNWGLLRSVEIPPADSDPPTGCLNVINGTSARDVLTGTAADDLIKGRRRNDRIFGLDGDDCIRPGRGRDRARGGFGDDEIRDGGRSRDRINCGPGDDTAIVSRKDRVKKCETVKRRRR
jgi:hypothetical protein